MDHIELLCIGNAIVDVFAELDSPNMDRMGLAKTVQHIPRDKAEQILGELGAGSGNGKPIISSGGGAANVAKIAAMLDISAAFSGCVGKDEYAGIFEEELKDAGVKPILSTGDEKTGICIILNNGKGDTRIAASPGAALELRENDICEETIKNADAVVLDGYILDRRPLVRRILELADRHGIPAALDAASVFQIREKAEEILQYCRNYPVILFMNADEGIAFYDTLRKSKDDKAPLTEREKEEMILRDVCPIFKIITDGEIFPIIVIKLGGRGAVVIAGGNVYREETFAVTPRDSIGAGDAFCAAFLAAWIRRRSLSECAVLGNKVAREILEVPGTRIKKNKLKAFAKYLLK
jgi:sugar/nucleoside kinase (ribokinase family)